MEHVSVLKGEVIELLDLSEGEVVVDGTLGLGGHSLEMVKLIGKSGKLMGFDQDERNMVEAKRRLGEYKNVTYFSDNFCNLKTRVTGVGIDAVDKILLDLGLSSPHVDDGERGFSFMKDGPLDMRFDLGTKLTAADVVNSYSEKDLALVFFKYGELKEGRKMARTICERREEEPFATTTDLAEFVVEVLPRHFHKNATVKVFQALRIEVNKELEVLEDVLEQAAELLKVGGRIAIMSYHSLEDRIVKQFFKALMQPLAVGEKAIYSKYDESYFKAITKKPVVP